MGYGFRRPVRLTWEENFALLDHRLSRERDAREKRVLQAQLRANFSNAIEAKMISPARFEFWRGTGLCNPCFLCRGRSGYSPSPRHLRQTYGKPTLGPSAFGHRLLKTIAGHRCD